MEDTTYVPQQITSFSYDKQVFQILARQQESNEISLIFKKSNKGHNFSKKKIKQIGCFAITLIFVAI
jgi:hypothetical protein